MPDGIGPLTPLGRTIEMRGPCASTGRGVFRATGHCAPVGVPPRLINDQHSDVEDTGIGRETAGGKDSFDDLKGTAPASTDH